MQCNGYRPQKQSPAHLHSKGLEHPCDPNHLTCGPKHNTCAPQHTAPAVRKPAVPKAQCVRLQTLCSATPRMRPASARPQYNRVPVESHAIATTPEHPMNRSVKVLCGWPAVLWVCDRPGGLVNMVVGMRTRADDGCKCTTRFDGSNRSLSVCVCECVGHQPPQSTPRASPRSFRTWRSC